MAVWDALEEQLASSDLDGELNEDSIFLQRMFGNCEFVSPDQQNRLSIPRHLREWASLRESDTAIILGSGTRLELWSRANWETYSNEFTAANAAQAISRRGISMRGDGPAREIVGGDAG
jgi:MraZ protein